SADYVSVAVELSVGMTMEEIKEQQRLEEERKKAEAAAKQKAKEQAAVDKASDLELLAALIYCEAGAESYEAQLAVGACVVNRMKHRNYPDTIKEVIFQKNQFTPAGSGKVARVLLTGKTTSSCLKAAAAALAGEDNTGGCRSFRLASTGRKGIVYGKIVFFSNTP
ncbi:MAG: cell wall hydrolase, partial [Agathobacter sp.]